MWYSERIQTLPTCIVPSVLPLNHHILSSFLQSSLSFYIAPINESFWGHQNAQSGWISLRNVASGESFNNTTNHGDQPRQEKLWLRETPASPARPSDPLDLSPIRPSQCAVRNT